ncbi:branched-chain amino acid ABC transporter permease/ATP-binding protein [Yinghuangia soli]|uniref:ATP-binding cassette domain-containing protein n=1 Tax=Yinghuangia soli TaxID=2908204 RepID=A0AA41Q8F9_9ACTN|nr:branched-chain amino acid ABC transporter permease/ATP-binding protein [Yinghuangia soli]MCF2533141.1 ATP-binding cassette domain-containing protein [Yinghuangia soli]
MNSQVLFDGLVNGLAIGLIAQGIVLVYRSTRVINFAVGNLGVLAAALLPLVCLNYGWPIWAALPAALVVGTLTGTLVELSVIRRLFTAPRVTVLIATIGVSQAAVAVVAALPDVRNALSAQYPVPVQGTWSVGGVTVTGAQASVLVVVPLVAGALSLLLNRTTVGRAVTGSADNMPLARTLGINPKLISTLVWTIAGLLSSLAMILVSGLSGGVTAVTDLGPGTMIRALAAAVVAGMVSFRWSMLAGVAIGVLQAYVRFEYVTEPGLVDLLLLGAVLAAVWAYARRDDRARSETVAFGPRVRAVPEHLRRIWWVRHLGLLAALPVAAAAVLLPLVVTQSSRHLLYATVLAYAICACSLTVLTGWSGQLSLGQMGFAGLGALTAALLTRGLTIGLGGDTRLIVEPLPFPVAILAAAAGTALLAAVIGFAALRVEGMLLAISTFALGTAAVGFLYRMDIFGAGTGDSVAFPRGTLFGLDLSRERTYYYVLLAVLALVVALLSRLRRTGPGRRMIAVRDNPDAAAAATVRPVRTKLVAFALSGALAGLGGGLLAGAVQSVPVTERFFQVGDSLMLVAIVVIGGLGSVWGPVLGSVWVIGLPAFFPGNELVPLFASSLGLLVLLMYFPGGLVQIGYALRGTVLDLAERRLGAAGADVAAARVPRPARAPATARAERRERPEPASGKPVLEVRDVTVRFGGNTAVDGVGMQVQADEIVGLIGTNGAGKSTLLGAIGGFVPASGTVELLGHDVSGWSPARRAALGLGRTFQAARLFPELTVRETVLVALEARGRSGLAATAAFLPGAVRAERRRRAEAADLIDLVGLGPYADQAVAGLSTGTRRIVELANLLALDARVLCLDEPTAGVAQRETEALGPLLLRLRRELGAAMVVIEHDMPFLMSFSDRLYCLEAGRVIAEGTPEQVRSDPAVIAGYLGTDDRAIDRSGVV